ncbi:MAG: DUF4358 domain-containing protein [Firmicutes bacterium]|nr:DUF4358 domain-containing protein [Bacillota bacterium]
MDPKGMSNNILESLDFDTDMTQVKKKAITTFIDLPEPFEGYMFMGDGAHADTFGVFAFASEDDSKDGEKAVKNYLKELEESFKRYIPEEADKVSNHSYLVRKGNNVVFVVSSDEEMAEEIVLQGFTESDEDTKIEVEDEDEKQPEETPEPQDTEEQGEDQSETTEPEDNENEDKEDEETTEPVSTEFNLNNYPKIDTDSKLKYIGYIGVCGRSAYEIYDYVESTASTYAKVINKAKKDLGNDVNVYDMVIPLSSKITIPNKYYEEMKGSDQRKALDNIYGKLNSKVIPVNIFETLMQHRDEKIYFRTDHHWTSLGAFYAYEKWCDVSGTFPVPLKGRDTIDMGDFVGSFYTDTKASALKKHPDKLKAYLPKGNCYIWGKDSEGNTTKADVIKDYSNSADFTKYDSFLGGDKGLVLIINKDVKDDSVLFVVKESFGNCLAPYFADHYHKVYVIDYRYFSKNIISYAKEKKATDLIFVNNIGMTRSTYLVGKLQEALTR